MKQCKCGSWAINLHLHGRDGSDDDLCDVCYWSTRAERLTREIAELKADRDSWIEQASARAQETVEAMQQVEAYRLRPVAWRFRFPTGGRWHYTEHGPNTHSKPELTWEPLYGHAALSAPREPLSVRADDGAHDWRENGVDIHKGECWYKCARCGQSDWIASYGTLDQLMPRKCVPQVKGTP